MATMTWGLQPANGKDLVGRVGFGITNIGPGLSAENPASLSVDWQLTNASSVELELGIDTDPDDSLMLVGGRYFRNVFIEDNTNFHVAMGGGLINQTVKGSENSGYYLEAGAGAKYFPPSSPNLGLGFLGLLGIRSASEVRFLTQGIFSAHYYF